MKPFMGNLCAHGHCKRTDCEKCYYYTPTCFGIKVPRWIGNMLFKFEMWLFKPKKISSKRCIMNTMQATCCMCGGSGHIMEYRPVHSDGVTTTLKRKKTVCKHCSGKGWTEYAVFSVEEAKAILKHCGLSTES